MLLVLKECIPAFGFFFAYQVLFLSFAKMHCTQWMTGRTSIVVCPVIYQVLCLIREMYKFCYKLPCPC